MIPPAVIPASCQVVVALKADTSSGPTQCLIGAIFKGSKADLQKVADWATAHGLIADAIKVDRADPSRFSMMIVFDPMTPSAGIISLIGENRSGRFGSAEMNVIIAPKAKAADGFDLDKEVLVGPVSGIVEPQP